MRGPDPVAGATPPKKQQGKAKGEREREPGKEGSQEHDKEEKVLGL